MKPENKVLSIINEEINLFETDISGHAFDQMRKRLDRMKSGGDITPEEDAEIRKNLNIISKEKEFNKLLDNIRG